MNGLQHLRIPAGQTYKSKGHHFVEGDASSASYWLAGAPHFHTGETPIPALVSMCFCQVCVLLGLGNQPKPPKFASVACVPVIPKGFGNQPVL